MLTICGAGSVGLAIGARLARVGEPVLFVTRRAEVAERIEREGVRVEDPGSGEAWTARAAARAGAAAAADRIGAGPLLFCVRTSQLEAAAAELAAAAPGASAVCLLNDVHNEAALARRFRRVMGGVVRQTTTRTTPNAVLASGPGRLVLGGFPQGLGPEPEALAGLLRAAGYDVGLSERILEDKWLKLCINLMSAPNALIRREDHESHAFVEGKARLLEEAGAALAAAGIAARSCDGRDRSLEAEIAWQRASLARGTSARRLPLYNQVWSALRRGGAVEADGYHRRIAELAARHGLAAPLNERVLAALERAAALASGPECLSARELLGDL